MKEIKKLYGLKKNILSRVKIVMESWKFDLKYVEKGNKKFLKKKKNCNLVITGQSKFEKILRKFMEKLSKIIPQNLGTF